MFPRLRALKPGNARGVLVGGNISVLADTIGTPCEVDTRDSILFLEDIGEDMEGLDSRLMQLKLAGKFKHIRGIVWGRLIRCYDRSGKKYNIRDILKDIFYDVEVPMLYGFPSGHFGPGRKQESNLTLPLGTELTMDTRSFSIFFHTAGVK
jgi:muramoyltetrapeptide carboxypeptidase